MAPVAASILHLVQPFTAMTESEKQRTVRAFLFEVEWGVVGTFFKIFSFFGDSTAQTIVPLLKDRPLTPDLVQRLIAALATSFAHPVRIEPRYRTPTHSFALLDWLEAQDVLPDARGRLQEVRAPLLASLDSPAA